MFHTAFLLILLLALPIIGSPVEVRNSVVTLPLTRRLNGTINLVQHDHDEARMAAFRDGRRVGSIPVTNTYDLIYTTAVGIDNLIVNSGSSVTWVGATTPYVETGTSISTKQPVVGSYGVVP
ncbi:hypothetical protein BDR04DRAFT_1161527 [Suillus decipiens]|nr:hypothetical protein BDR04DRAFT_1161527 [Suillus decipiens]